VLLNLSADDLNNDLRRHLELAAVVASAVLLIGFGVTFVLARGITRPVAQLAAVAATVQDGTFAPEVLDRPTRRKDELGRLARFFRHMAGEVKAREERLRHAEEDLKRSEAHFRSLIENASDMIMIGDARGIIQYVSPSFERTLGYKPRHHPRAHGPLPDRRRPRSGRRDGRVSLPPQGRHLARDRVARQPAAARFADPGRGGQFP
jgi:PAS domain-containing protein